MSELMGDSRNLVSTLDQLALLVSHAADLGLDRGKYLHRLIRLIAS